MAGSAHQIEVFPSASRTATATSATYSSKDCRGLHIAFNLTVLGSGSISLVLQGYDATAGLWYDILVPVAVTTIGHKIYKMYPGIPVSTAVNDILPTTWRIVVTPGDSVANTYSVIANLVL